MLTPAFQEQSGGIEGYEGFWGDVRSAKVESIEADPDALEVSYTYRYNRPPGGPTTDDVTLRLTFEDGDLPDRRRSLTCNFTPAGEVFEAGPGAVLCLDSPHHESVQASSGRRAVHRGRGVRRAGADRLRDRRDAVPQRAGAPTW